MVTTRLTMLRLGYLGFVPFLFSLLLIVSDTTLFNLSGQQFFIAYSAVILSFLSGVLWGNGIDHYYHRLSRNILVLSNLFVLLAWGPCYKGIHITSRQYCCSQPDTLPFGMQKS